MQGVRRGEGAARLRVVGFVAAVLALVVGLALPAAGHEKNPPTLVSFSRTSPTPVSPGQAVTLSYTATDDSSGGATVVFPFTDARGNSRTLTGPGGGPTSVSATVDSSWATGNYRLDEIDVTDRKANVARYVRGSTSFDLDSANFTVTDTAPTPT